MTTNKSELRSELKALDLAIADQDKLAGIQGFRSHFARRRAGELRVKRLKLIQLIKSENAQ